MALNSTTLKDLMKANILAIAGYDVAIPDDRVLEAIASAIVTHITTDAQLTGSVTTPDTVNGTITTLGSGVL